MDNRFPQIPPPTIAEPDYAGTLARVKKQYQGITGHYPDTNDPETFLLEQLAHERELLVDDINQAAAQNLLGYASGDDLDNLGVLVGTTRLPASSATTSAELTLSANHPDFVLVAGYEVMARDGTTLFHTTEDIAVRATDADITTSLTAAVPGLAGNGFLPGEISTIVTQNPYVTAVSNITTSQGGADTEKDDRFASRIYLSPSRFSVAGPYDAYRYFVRSTSPAITDVAVWSPEPNDIFISAVLEGGVVPDAALKQAILDTLSDRTVRPLGDRITVMDSSPVEASGELNVEIYRSAASLAEQITRQITARVDALTLAWRNRLGRDIVPEVLEAAGQTISGVYRCTTTLEYQKIPDEQFPVVTITQINVTLVDEEIETG
ncbi:baseplate J/gp47 family protein [Enterobacter kobei]